MKIAIHQPNFFPWLGYFDKINKADLFVYLDHVENNPRDSGWFKSVKILVNGNEYWLIQPLKRPNDVTQAIMDMEVTNQRTAHKNMKTIKQNYSNSQYFDQVFPLVEDYFKDDESLLAEKNISFIEKICWMLHINTSRKRSSDFRWEREGTELLVDIVKKYDGETYISGGGSEGYQEDSLFSENNITLKYQNFSHPIYNQCNAKEFIPGLSVLDALFNIGAERTRELLEHS